MPAREDTINVQLGEVLQELRPDSWRVLAEHQRTLRDTNARPDILIEEPAGWPVVIEAERENHASAESDAQARLGAVVDETGRPIESAIALVYPPDVREQTGGKATRAALYATDALEYALYTATSGDAVERLPESGWLRGNIRDLAMLAQRAAIPAPRVERLVDTLEHGVHSAEGAFNRHHREHTGDHLGPEIAEILGQSDDQGGQTRRMAMTVLINALIFHESLAQAEFRVNDGQRRVARVRDFIDHASGFDQQRIIDEWRAILAVNYWPIFATAAEILDRMPIVTANEVLASLWRAAGRLISGGVTKSHDLTGVIFQRLIADRKFLATFYTRPAAAALLAALALPADRPPRGAAWSDAEAISDLQIGDFACGTGTLLSAAYQRISLLHELNKGDPKALHPQMMKRGLHGLDVLNISVHLTAAILAGSHPDVPFDGECLLTMPYGRWGEGKRDVAIGSLDLLAEHVQTDMIDHASAITAGGRNPEDVRDLVNRVSHGKFDLVIMNPPFTRQGGQEGERVGVGNAGFAAFQTTRETQDRMQERLRTASGDERIGSGNAGLASHFVDLAHRKLRIDGTMAFVLPLSSVSGASWETVRALWRRSYRRITVVTAPGSFSADTGMAECLVVAQRSAGANSRRGPRAVFAVLNSQPTSVTHSSVLAAEISRLIDSGDVRRLDQGIDGGTPIVVGDERCGYLMDCPIDSDIVWPLVGIADPSLAQVAHQLQNSMLPQVGWPKAPALSIPIVATGKIASAGPYSLDIKGDQQDGSPRGPFRLVKPPATAEPTYPMLWENSAVRQRRLLVDFDSEGQVKEWPSDQEVVDEKAASISSTATRAHYNIGVRFNSQSLLVAMTERECIGGRGWPSAIFDDSRDEYLFSLWCNSTLGLLLHWWASNKTQLGRGSISVTSILNMPTLDARQVPLRQKNFAEEAFAA